MSLGTNLQFLRKRSGMTQESFAEKLDISRQTVSKWESDVSFPEMEKLLQLCDVFGCDLDTLTRGDAAASLAEDTAGYERHMNGFTWAICSGVFLPLFGVAAMLLMTGLGVHDALCVMVLLSFVLVAAAVFIVSGIQHGHFVRKHPMIRPFYRQEQIDAFDRKFPFLIAVPTVLILLGVIALVGILGQSGLSEAALNGATTALELFCGAGFIGVIALAAPMYVYGGLQKYKYNVQEYNQTNSPTEENQRRNRLTGTACSAIMLTATAVYLVMGFGFDLWRSAAIPFAVGGVLCGIASVIIEGIQKKKE